MALGPPTLLERPARRLIIADLQQTIANTLAANPIAMGSLVGSQATVAAILRAYGGAYLAKYRDQASNEQLRVLQLLTLCRTPSLGLAQWECTDCGLVRETYNPCRDRHCSQCQGHLERQWAEARLGEVLPIAYQHVIFTAPHEIHVLLDVWSNLRLIYPLYQRAARDALQRVAAEQLGVRLGMADIVHTWNQQGLHHVHVHVIMPLGGWSIKKPEHFVQFDAEALDVERLMVAFREALLSGICRLAEKGRLALAGEAAFLNDGRAFGAWIDQLNNRHWVLRPQPPLESPETAIGYLARYTRRAPIDNRRILEFDSRRGKVTFGYRNNGAGPNGQDIDDVLTIDAVEFIRRLLLHVMPKGLSRTRFHGWWASGKKGKELPRIRIALGAPPEPEPAKQEKEPDPEFQDALDEAVRIRCPLCRKRTLERVLQIPMPRLYDLMQLVLWPEQEKEPTERQTLLPEMKSWLPGGEAFRTSLYAQLPGASTSGFT